MNILKPVSSRKASWVEKWVLPIKTIAYDPKDSTCSILDMSRLCLAVTYQADHDESIAELRFRRQYCLLEGEP